MQSPVNYANSIIELLADAELSTANAALNIALVLLSYERHQARTLGFEIQPSESQLNVESQVR